MSTRDKQLSSLFNRIKTAKGADRNLDADIEHLLRRETRMVHGPKNDPPGYTSSIDECMALLHAVMPDWHWHIGRDASGVFPYAMLSHGRHRVSCDGISVPLALLAAIVEALVAQEKKERHRSGERED